MINFLDFIKELLMLKKSDNIKVGLTQFKEIKPKVVVKEVSITNKNVKLSDLMRRVS